MAKDLNHKQFLQMWYNRCDIQNKHVKNHMEDIYNGLLSVIQEEVRLNGSIRLKNLGKFYLIETGGYERKNLDGDYVNDAIVSKEGRRNKKRGTLTPLEQELEEREAEKSKTDIKRMLERKKKTGENIKTIVKDSRMQLQRRT